MLTFIPGTQAQTLTRLRQAVAPSQVTPQSFAPPAASNPNAFEISAAAGLTAPAGAEEFSLLVGRVLIEGAFPDLAAENARLTERLAQKRVSVAEIFAAAADLERAYARAGYVLVRLTAPPQKLVDGGEVRLVVIDGFIEKITADGTPERVRAPVMGRVAGLVGRKGLKLAEIERAVLLAGDLSGLKLRSALARGEEIGGSILALEGEHRLMTAAIGLDNRLPQALGGRQGNTSVSVNSPFGFGEQFYATAGSSIGDMSGSIPFTKAPLRVIGVGALAPVGADGLTLNPEFTLARSTRDETLQTPRTQAQFERFAMRASYPLIRERAQTLIAKAGLEYILQHIHAPAFETNLNADRYRAARFELDWQARAPWEGPFRLDMQFSKGLGGRNGADASWSGVPLSRQGGSPWFNKFFARGSIMQTLPEELQLNVVGMGQTSFGKPLLLPEQLSLEGPEALAGLSPGAVMVDTGGTLRSEVSRSLVPAPSEHGVLTLSPYVFVAGGVGRIHEATIIEKSSVLAGSFGAGARTTYARNDGFGGLTLGIEFGQQYSNIPGRKESRRVNAYGALHF